MSRTLTRLEQETIVSLNEKESLCEIYTCSEFVKLRMKKAGLVPDKTDAYGAWYSLPKDAVRLNLYGGGVVQLGGPRRKNDWETTRFDSRTHATTGSEGDS